MSRDTSSLGSPSRPSLPPGRTNTSAFNALLSETLGPSTTPALTAKEAEIEAWMAPGGRLRIGSDGVPVKFNLHKVAAARAVATAALRSSPSPSSAQQLLRSTTTAVTHDSQATLMSQSTTTTTTATTSTTSVSSSTAEINHGLQLLVALVGEPAMSQLGLG